MVKKPVSEKKIRGPDLACVSIRAGVDNKLAQTALYKVSVIPKTGAWAQQIKIGKKDYVVAMDRSRLFVIVLPVPFFGDDEEHGYSIIKAFNTIKEFEKQLHTL